MFGCEFDVAVHCLEACGWSMDSGILNLYEEWFYSSFFIFWEVLLCFDQNWLFSGGVPFNVSQSTSNGGSNPLMAANTTSSSIPLLCDHCQGNVIGMELWLWIDQGITKWYSCVSRRMCVLFW